MKEVSEDIIERLRGVADNCDLCTADVRAADDAIVEIERLRRIVAAYDSDAQDAAGEYLIPVPTPGTPMAKLLVANVLMRRRNETFNSLVNCVRREVTERAAWLSSLPDGSCGNPPPEGLVAAEVATRDALAEIDGAR